MLIHRVAAWFGMEHNVDGMLQCVIVGTTKTTRVPEVDRQPTHSNLTRNYFLHDFLYFLQTRFKSLLTDTFTDEPPSRKSILKREAHSFEEYRQGLLGCPDRNMLDRKAKSFEEREQEYERAKRRIFKDMDSESIEQFWHNWSNTVSAEHYKFGNSKVQNNRLLKVQSSVSFFSFIFLKKKFSFFYAHIFHIEFQIHFHFSRWTHDSMDDLVFQRVIVLVAMDHRLKLA